MKNTNCQMCGCKEAKMSASIIKLDRVCNTCFIQTIDSLMVGMIEDDGTAFIPGYVPQAILNAAQAEKFAAIAANGTI